VVFLLIVIQVEKEVRDVMVHLEEEVIFLSSSTAPLPKKNIKEDEEEEGNSNRLLPTFHPCRRGSAGSDGPSLSD